MRTKWDILQERLDLVEKQAKEQRSYLEGLDLTKCGITCSGCGTLLETEGDFARHFLIPNERFLNLGGCPVTDYNQNNKE